MNSETIKKVTTQAIEQLSEALKAGRSEALTNYLGAMARFRTYSLLNVLLILKQRPSATRVAGYRTWHSFGRQVKKGEKGIMILAPTFRKREDAPTNDRDRVATRALAGFRSVYVWDLQQTTGKDLPQLTMVKGDPSGYLNRLETFVLQSGITLRYSNDIAPAKGMAQEGQITLLPDQTPAETFATLVHELAHSELHFGERRPSTDKRIRETEAESVAFVVSTAIGLDAMTSSRDYVALYGGDAKALLGSLEYVHQAATHILNSIELQVQEQAA